MTRTKNKSLKPRQHGPPSAYESCFLLLDCTHTHLELRSGVLRKWTSSELMVRYAMVLSVNGLTLEESDSGRSLKRNRHGPKTEPCGTPENTSTSSEDTPFSKTRSTTFSSYLLNVSAIPNVTLKQ